MKTALITGASRGIGKATAELFADNGYAVIINYNKSEKEALSLVSEIREKGGTAMAVKADVSNETEVSEMMKKISENSSSIDVLINNAGISLQKMLTETTTEEWDNIFGITARGTFLVISSGFSSSRAAIVILKGISLLCLFAMPSFTL